MERLCACSKRMRDLDEVNYVLNGVPICTRGCFDSYVAIQANKARARLELARREEATRITGSFKEGFNVHG